MQQEEVKSQKDFMIKKSKKLNSKRTRDQYEHYVTCNQNIFVAPPELCRIQNSIGGDYTFFTFEDRKHGSSAVIRMIHPVLKLHRTMIPIEDRGTDSQTITAPAVTAMPTEAEL